MGRATDILLRSRWDILGDSWLLHVQSRDRTCLGKEKIQHDICRAGSQRLPTAVRAYHGSIQGPDIARARQADYTGQESHGEADTEFWIDGIELGDSCDSKR